VVFLIAVGICWDDALFFVAFFLGINREVVMQLLVCYDRFINVAVLVDQSVKYRLSHLADTATRVRTVGRMGYVNMMYEPTRTTSVR
jgi:hypothetical protein